MVKSKVLVIADDFTGAADTGVQFGRKRLRTIVLTDVDQINRSLNNYDVVVVDTESRFESKEAAYRKAFEAVKSARGKGIRYVYKKLDSTFRGNAGAEISGIMDSLEVRHAIIAPALPFYGRITKNGNVYVNGLLLAETEFANDPVTPVKESYIPRIISRQTDKRVEVINHDDVLAGKQNLIRKVQKHMKGGIHMIVIDALVNEDLDIIASAVTSLRERFLYAGSSGFAGHLTRYIETDTVKKSNIIIAGSVSEVTCKQIDYLKGRLPVTLIDIETRKLFTENRLSEKNRILEIVEASSRKGYDIVIRSAASGENVSRSFEAGQEYGLDKLKVCETIAVFMGEISGEIIKKIRINGILFTGGDTAFKALQSMNISGTVIHDEILPGIPYGHFVSEQYGDIVVVTKAGGFGDEDAVFRVLNFLNNR